MLTNFQIVSLHAVILTPAQLQQACYVCIEAAYLLHTIRSV